MPRIALLNCHPPDNRLVWERRPRPLALKREKSMGKRPLTRKISASSPSNTSCQGGRQRPGPPPRKSFISSTGDPVDHGRSGANGSKEDDTYLGDMLPEDEIQDAGYEADVEIIRPYAIEEPGEETDQTPTSVATPKLLDSTEQWQNELLNSMRGLYCDSDSTDTPPLVRHKRGRKRKPDTSMTATRDFQSTQQQSMKEWGSDVHMGAGSSLLSPKRRRRKSTKSEEDIQVSHGSLLASENASTASSSVNLSTGTHNNGSPPVLQRELSAKDRMDID